MLKKIRFPVELVIYTLLMYYYSEYIVSREVSSYILWPSTIVIIYLTWYIIKQILKTIFKQLEL
jgi:hypothetical protein